MTTKKKSTDSAGKQNKVYHIDVRFTEEDFKLVVGNAAKCGMPKSLYVHDATLGYQPKLVMTEGQEAALKGVSAARAELVGIRNALQGLTQEERKRLFRNERFMLAWIEGINYLIQYWDTIKDKFMR